MSIEVVKWLKENAYAVKGGEYWFLVDFPSGETPERLEIPVSKQSWGKWNLGQQSIELQEVKDENR